MVNHFASLLSNLDLSSTMGDRDEYLLAGGSLDTAEFFLVTRGGDRIYLSGAVEQESIKSYSALTYKYYIPLELPPELENFRSLLFAERGAKYYQQFLLYCYLRLLAATNLKDYVKVYDKRITYDLEEFSEYFRSSRLSPTTTNDTRFKLLVHGNMPTDDSSESFANHVVVGQLHNTSAISIYSVTQAEYYKPGKFASKRIDGMSVELLDFIDPSNPRVTKPIALSDTGLSISLTGPLDQLTSTANKVWTFSTEAPFIFDFPAKLALIKNSDRKVDAMLSYSKDSVNPAFEYIWRAHPNSIYALAGLLLAYVERVNLVWETRRT